MKSIFTTSKLSLFFLMLTFCLSASSNILYAQKTWLGNTSDWHTDSNWDPIGTPEDDDDVIIPVTSNDPEVTTGAIAATVLVYEGAKLTIKATGQLTLTGSSPYIGRILNNGSVINEGHIEVDHSLTIGIFNTGPTSNFLNQGSIEIGTIPAGGIFAIRNNGQFINDLSGDVFINNTVSGLGVGPVTSGDPATFINNGSIEIGNSGTITTNALSVSGENSFFTNEVQGSINLNGGISGILVSGTFQNKGSINIGNLVSSKLGISCIGSFTNDISGEISINQASSRSVDNRGEFINKGSLQINTLQPTSGKLFNRSQAILFLNEACSQLRMEGRLDLEAPFTNNGLLSLSTLVSQNTGQHFTNNGIIEDLSGSLEFSSAQITNNEIIIAPSSGPTSGITPAFDLGNGGTFEVLGVYTDQALQNPVGTYDQNTNTFTCNLALGEHTLYVDVEDGDTDCPYITTWKVTIESSLPSGWETNPNGIDCTNGNEATFDNQTQTFTITSEGCYDPNYYSNSDSHGFVYTELCGDGEIIAEIQSVDGSGWAGISMRESTDPGAKMLQLLLDGYFLTRRQMRTSTNGLAFNHYFQTQGKNWLRLTRSGSTFGAHHSLDGINWSPVLISTLDMPNCIPIGLVTMNSTPSGSLTATFGNVEVKTNMALYTPRTVDITEAEQQFSIYPNPANDRLWISTPPTIDQEVQVKVYNQLGQAVLQQKVAPTQSVDISALLPGAYWVEVIANQQREVQKVVVE